MIQALTVIPPCFLTMVPVWRTVKEKPESGITALDVRCKACLVQILKQQMEIFPPGGLDDDRVSDPDADF